MDERRACVVGRLSQNEEKILMFVFIQGVEILWTPQDKNDTLTERDLLRNYPLLKSL